MWPLLLGASAVVGRVLLPAAIGYSAFQMGSWSEGNKGQTDIISGDRAAQLEYDWMNLQFQQEKFLYQQEQDMLDESDEYMEEALDVYGDYAYRGNQAALQTQELQAKADQEKQRRLDVESDRNRYMFQAALAERTKVVGTLEETAYVLSELYTIRDKAYQESTIRPNPTGEEELFFEESDEMEVYYR